MTNNKENQKIPYFKCLMEALDNGYAKKVRYFTDISSLKKQKYIGVEKESIVIVKPFYLDIHGRKEFMNEIGKPVIFATHGILTDKGLEEKRLRQAAYQREFCCDIIKTLNRGEYG